MLILDGLFYRVDAVAIAEIRDVIAAGWRVYGGVSMGALRAVECSSLGMRGHGFVFRWLVLNGIEDDDELAVASHPHALTNLSDAMVDLRWLARSCRLQGLVSRQVAAAALDEVKRLPFHERSRSALISRLSKGSAPQAAARIAGQVADSESLKARDARSILAWARRHL